MKKLGIFLMLALLLGFTANAQAAPVINDPWADPGGAEMNLYQIFANSLFNGGTYTNSQDIADTLTIKETLAPGTYTVTAVASFAGFSQDPGVYAAGDASTALYFKTVSSDFPIAGSSNKISAINLVNIFASVDFGFFDDNTASGGDIQYTELALNAGSFSQSNGLIFKVSDYHYIVAFEDGAAAASLGDKDYNDLVLNVVTCPSPAPIPGGLLLLGSGLVGLLGLRRKMVA